GVGRALHVALEHAEVVQGRGDVRIGVAESLPDRECVLVALLRGVERAAAALRGAERRPRRGDIGVGLAERGAPDREGARIDLLGLLVVFLLEWDRAEVIAHLGDVWVVSAGRGLWAG